jgi:hypothetical protein
MMFHYSKSPQEIAVYFKMRVLRRFPVRAETVCLLHSVRTESGVDWATYPVGSSGKRDCGAVYPPYTFMVWCLIKPSNFTHIWSRGSTVGIVPRFRDGRSGYRGSIHGRNNFSLLCIAQTVSEAHPPYRAVPQADHLPLSSVEVMNAWSCISSLWYVVQLRKGQIELRSSHVIFHDS